MARVAESLKELADVLAMLKPRQAFHCHPCVLFLLRQAFGGAAVSALPAVKRAFPAMAEDAARLLAALVEDSRSWRDMLAPATIQRGKFFAVFHRNEEIEPNYVIQINCSL